MVSPASGKSGEISTVQVSSFTFIMSGHSISLSTHAEQAVSEKVIELIAGCWYYDQREAGHVPPKSPEDLWEEELSGSYIYMRFRKPLAIAHLGGKSFPASEVLIGLNNPVFIGPELIRHRGKTTSVFKCSGQTAMELMCMAELEKYFPEAYRRNCHLLKR